MVAIAHQDARTRLRLVTADEVARRQQAELAVMRRRAVAVGVVVALLLALGMLLGRTSGGAAVPGVPGSGAAAGAAATAPLPVAERAYVVQPGDTVWEIARALQPDGDVRPLVSELQRARQGRPLRVGERISLP